MNLLSTPAEFDGTPVLTGDTVTRHGRIFRPGDYPDKGFALTPEEALALAADFQPVPVDLEHVPTVLSGKLGTLRRVKCEAADDYALHGELEIPAWLHETLGAEPVKVSGTFDRATKRLVGLALVRTPRVTDAAMMAAFARHDTPQGQAAMQHIHDAAAQHGATCRKPTADMASKHEASAIQQAHDLAVEHGARCAGSGSGVGPAFYSDDGQQATPPRERQGGRMNAWEWLQGQLSKTHAPGSDGDGEPAKMSQGPPKTADPPTPDPRIAALAEQLAAERGKRWQAEAAQFAEAEIVTHKRAMPYERGALIGAYLQAARDDQEHPAKVTFAVGGKAAEGSRVDSLRALQAARPAHHLTAELLDPTMDAEKQAAEFARLTASFAAQHDASLTGKEKAPTAERIAELKRMTPLGEAVLNGSKGN